MPGPERVVYKEVIKEVPGPEVIKEVEVIKEKPYKEDGGTVIEREVIKEVSIRQQQFAACSSSRTLWISPSSRLLSGARSS